MKPFKTEPMTEKHDMSDVSRRQGQALLLCGLGVVAFAAFTYFILPRLAVAADTPTARWALRWLVGSIAVSGVAMAFFGWAMLPSVKSHK